MKQKLEIKIIKIYEKDSLLRVETETKYGKDNLGLGLDKKYLNPVTDQPKWKDEVRKLLERKYLKENATPVKVESDIWGQTI